MQLGAQFFQACDQSLQDRLHVWPKHLIMWVNRRGNLSHPAQLASCVLSASPCRSICRPHDDRQIFKADH